MPTHSTGNRIWFPAGRAPFPPWLPSSTERLARARWHLPMQGVFHMALFSASLNNHVECAWCLSGCCLLDWVGGGDEAMMARRCHHITQQGRGGEGAYEGLTSRPSNHMLAASAACLLRPQPCCQRGQGHGAGCAADEVLCQSPCASRRRRKPWPPDVGGVVCIGACTACTAGSNLSFRSCPPLCPCAPHPNCSRRCSSSATPQ